MLNTGIHPTPWASADFAPPRRVSNIQLQHEPDAREPEEMQHLVHYTVDIHCSPCPEGSEAEITRQLRAAFPVTNCRNTPTGLALRLTAGHQYAYGALRDFADLIADTLTRLGISMTSGVVRLVTRGTPDDQGVWHRVQDATAALVGLDLRPARETPVLYFYKGLRFDLDLNARLKGTSKVSEVGAI